MTHAAPIVIMGGGPAGLTAALELGKTGKYAVVLIEQESQVGGISKTVNYKGNRMDIGGHRFFSKSDAVMEWWQRILPIQTHTHANEDDVMLVRSRLSRIFYLRKFFAYPISLTWETLRKLGFPRVCSMAATYMHALLFPRKPEKSLEDFFINRFGKTLYNTFFRDYTEKVWGVPCNKIAADWGAQRVKNLSVLRVLRHALLAIFAPNRDMRQKDTDTSLIEQFLYPKFGPGQLWERVAREVEVLGGQILLNHTVTGIDTNGGIVSAVRVRNNETGETTFISCAAAISSLPIRELVRMLPTVPQEVRSVSDALIYRDFITVGLLAGKLALRNPAGDGAARIQDNWIYIQEPDVRIGRIQIFNNWSPWLVSDPSKVWMGLEYFATEGDVLWEMPDSDFIAMAIRELISLGFVQADDIEDATLLRVKKAYPAYFGGYSEISVVQNFLNGVPNLYPVGRNGMHRYNNMDHSMLSAMQAVACILDPARNKRDIWNINEEQGYHETRQASVSKTQ